MATKYLFVYRTIPDPTEQRSPEQLQAMMTQWHDWRARFKDNILDVGDGLKPGGRVLKNGVLSDGPYVEAKEVLGGYSIVQAETYEQAAEVARACPFTRRPHYNIEIRELAGH